MNDREKDERGKITVEECVNLKISKQVMDFAEFYAEIGSMERDELLTIILTERLTEIRDKFKSMPYLQQIPELF